MTHFARLCFLFVVVSAPLQIHRQGRLVLHTDSDGALRKTRRTGATTTTTATATTLGGLAFAAPPPLTTTTAVSAGSKQPRIRRPRQRGGCPQHCFSSLSLLSLAPPPPHQGLRASIAPGGSETVGRRGGGGGEKGDGGGLLSSSASLSSPSPLGAGRLGERSLIGRGGGVSTSTSRRSSTTSSEVSSANNSSGQGQGYRGSSSGGGGSRAAAAGVWSGRARFSSRPGVAGGGGGGGVRSGGAMAHELRPLLDTLDCARGHRATGVAAMKVTVFFRLDSKRREESGCAGVCRPGLPPFRLPSGIGIRYSGVCLSCTAMRYCILFWGNARPPSLPQGRFFLLAVGLFSPLPSLSRAVAVCRSRRPWKMS